MHEAFVVFGSNINPERNLYTAWVKLQHRVEVVASSSIWESPPYGSVGPDFLNAVVQVNSSNDLEALKWSVLRKIETSLGRVRTADKFASRPIDLDIFIFDSIIQDANLWELAYLAAPCAELLPDLPDPTSGRPLAEVAVQMAAEQNTVRRFRSFLELV